MKRYLVLLVAVACACVTSPENTNRLLADIGRGNDRRIDAPDTVRVNVPFEVTVYAVGSRSIECNYPDGTSVRQEGNVARIEGYIRVPNRVHTCPSDFMRYPQTATVRFPFVGVGTIRLLGSVARGDFATTLDSLDRTVVVVP